jgi:Tfp pilus assembly protein PilX
MHNTNGFNQTIFRQAGAALFMSLIFLLIMTILGVFGMNVSRMENLMAGNTQFQTTALNNAEFLLAEAEEELDELVTSSVIKVYNDDGSRNTACEAAWPTDSWNASCDYFYERINDNSILVGDTANLVWSFNKRKVVLPDGTSEGYYILENTGSRLIKGGGSSFEEESTCGGGSCVWVFLATAQTTSGKGARRIVQSVVVTRQPPQ